MESRHAHGLDPIVSAAWVAAHLDDLIVCDVRAYLDERNGRDAYDAGHLPGARFLDLETELSDIGDPTRGRHPLPAPQRFAEVLGAHGIAASATVVAYDDAGGAFASRLVWMLRVLGQPAAILDGGVDAWPGELTAEVAPVDVVEVAPRPWPVDAVMNADDVTEHVERGGVLVDSRGAARYRGEIEAIDPLAGHIPGAINLPFAENLVEGRFADPDALRDRFETAGISEAAVF